MRRPDRYLASDTERLAAAAATDHAVTGDSNPDEGVAAVRARDGGDGEHVNFQSTGRACLRELHRADAGPPAVVQDHLPSSSLAAFAAVESAQRMPRTATPLELGRRSGGMHGRRCAASKSVSGSRCKHRLRRGIGLGAFPGGRPCTRERLSPEAARRSHRRRTWGRTAPRTSGRACCRR